MNHFQSAIKNTEKYLNSFLNIISQNYNYYNEVINIIVYQKFKQMTPIIQEYGVYIINQSFYYYTEINEYFNKNYDNIIMTLLLLIFLILFIILDYQRYNKRILENEILSDKQKLIERIKELESHSHKLHRENEKNVIMLDLYKSIKKPISDFGYFKLEGQQSSRGFRRMIKSMNGEYLGKNIFLVPTRYIGEFIDSGYVSINDMN